MFIRVYNIPLLTVLMLLSVLLLCVLIILISTLMNDQKDDTEKKTDKNYDGGADQEFLPFGDLSEDSVRSVGRSGEGREHAVNMETQAMTCEPQALSPRITINRETAYRPAQLSRPFNFSGKTSNPQNDDRRYLIIEKSAYTKLKSELEWGRKTRRNCVEQGGILLGRAAFYNNEIYCFVEDILLADTSGNPVFVEFSDEMWADMQNRFDAINALTESGRKLVIVGWFHTHPNGLSVFMSGTDMQTQRLNFAQEWQVSLVMNPHTHKCRAFFGVNAIDGRIVFPESLG